MSDPGEKYYAIVFADIVGSTQMYESLGDRQAKKLINTLEDIIAQVVIETGGDVVEVVGDEVMSRYDRVSDAVEGACLIQERVDEYAKQSNMGLSARIGLHYGPAIVENGRMFGDSVNVAARMASIAQSQQIITTEQVVERLSDLQRQIVRRFDKVSVKGKQGQMVIYDLLWRKDDVTFIYTSPRTQTKSTRVLVLEYAGKRIRFLQQHETIRIGRESHNELVVATAAASRTHAVLKYSRGKYMLSDISTNGTYLTTQNQQSLYLRRETVPLLGSGKIGLGEPVSEENHHVISYYFQEI
ncbi:MAG: adenylate/guanylate cyclase domain-containing protein [Candidatus Thiodiazotropha sp.]